MKNILKSYKFMRLTQTITFGKKRNEEKEEVVEIGEKVPNKTSEVKKPVEVKEVKPSEPEMDDDIEIIEEVVPKVPSKPSEPEVISLEMKLPEPVKTVRVVQSPTNQKSVDYFREKFNLLKKRKTEEQDQESKKNKSM